VNLKVWVVQGILDSLLIVEGDETETSWSTGILVDHESGVQYTAELLEVLLEIRFGALLRDTTDEDLAGLLLLIPRNSPLWINLPHN
jgi:hypothetical protein